ncbi:carboxypeptidase-like regulatory domain-containing protein [Micromonospora sp. LOL_024]|uniref:carboxypeptidase-like regulatory domain-containing protein n=1 Tax=Micromonospora sp. LOL_024 TaxID=3345412 RepID=UPI003A83EEDF
MPPSLRHTVPIAVAALVAGLGQPPPALASPGPTLPRAAATHATPEFAATGPPTTVALTPGRVRTTLHDVDTGQAVRGCLSLVPVDRDRLTVVSLGEEQAGRHGGCTGVDGGDLVATDVPPGQYHLLARPYDSERYGWQWVGRHGGTGQRERGVALQVRPGRTVTAPPVRLDPPGTITGRVTRAAGGTPVSGGHVLALPAIPHPKYDDHGAITDDDGRYTLTGLGPYRWPLHFTGHGLASQWSGGTADRTQARPARVRAGATATFDQELVAGTVVSGTVTVAQLPHYSQVIAFHARTGDAVGVGELGADYTMRLLPGQRVVLRCDCAYAPSRWFPNAAEIAGARPIRVRHRPVTADFDLTGPGSAPPT